MPGVTRDPIEVRCTLSGRDVLLIDTGGYRVQESDIIEELVTERTKKIVESSDIVLLVLDVNELTPEDESFIEYLRPFSSKILLVVNKVDSNEKGALIWNYYRYGFETVVGVSAAHGRNVDDLIDIISGLLIEKGETPKEIRREKKVINIAVLGKPNTGKSTLTNVLAGSEKSIVSEVPGTTRDVIENQFGYAGTWFRILDTAGIRRKKKVTEDVEYYSVNRAIHSITEADVVYLLIDSLDGLTDQDKKIAQQVVKRGRGIILVLTKWDKMEQIPNLFTAMKDRISFFFPILTFAPVMKISATEGTGIKKLLTTTVKVYDQLEKRVETPVLNRKLQEWSIQYAPPQERNVRYKPRYLTQVSINPVQFVLFVNKKNRFPSSYVQYIKNKIRNELGFSHIPLSVEIRETH
jgi:GTP-binding protein